MQQISVFFSETTTLCMYLCIYLLVQTDGQTDGQKQECTKVRGYTIFTPDMWQSKTTLTFHKHRSKIETVFLIAICLQSGH